MATPGTTPRGRKRTCRLFEDAVEAILYQHEEEPRAARPKRQRRLDIVALANLNVDLGEEVDEETGQETLTVIDHRAEAYW